MLDGYDTLPNEESLRDLSALTPIGIDEEVRDDTFALECVFRIRSHGGRRAAHETLSIHERELAPQRECHLQRMMRVDRGPRVTRPIPCAEDP